MRKDKPTWSRNVEEIITVDLDITKKEFAELIPTSPQTISKACNGVRLSKGLAIRICELYPEYNLAWVLGMSPNKYVADENAAQAAFRQLFEERLMERERRFFEGVFYLADYAGFSCGFDGEKLSIAENASAEPETFTQNELRELKEDVSAYMKYRVRKLLERGR